MIFLTRKKLLPKIQMRVGELRKEDIRTIGMNSTERKF